MLGRLSNRFSIGNRLARLSTNWGLPDALARLGLADPSAPLHPAPHPAPPQPSPIAEEGNADSDEAAITAPESAESTSQYLEADTELQQQQQSTADDHSSRSCQQSSLRGGRQLQRQSVQCQKHAASFAAPRLSPPPTAAMRDSSDDSSSVYDQEAAARQLPAQAHGVAPPGSNIATRAAFASLSNAPLDQMQSELRHIA